MKKETIEVGQVFGQLTIIEELSPRIYNSGGYENKIRMFDCRCSCGGSIITFLLSLKCGQKTRCNNCSFNFLNRQKLANILSPNIQGIVQLELDDNIIATEKFTTKEHRQKIIDGWPYVFGWYFLKSTIIISPYL